MYEDETAGGEPSCSREEHHFSARALMNHQYSIGCGQQFTIVLSRWLLALFLLLKSELLGYP